MGVLAGSGITSSIWIFASSPGRAFGFSSSTFSTLGAFLVSFLPPFLAFSAYSSLFFFSSSFFLSIQSN
jgi:hypothetical protein